MTLYDNLSPCTDSFGRQVLVVKLQISQMPVVELLKKDMIIDVEIDGDKLGEFRLSKGSVDYYPKGAKKAHHWLSWQDLAKLMVENGKAE